MEELLSNYQVATLVAVPSYPNSLTWSEENLVAVASENLITILNPSSLTSARGLITLKQSKPFLLGLVERKALLTPCLQPICLSRDTRPYARSISWSPPGLAPNSGCFLAVCTLDGHVKLYRAPYCEYSSEWIEVVDISDLLFYHIKSINFGEQHDPPMGIREVNASNICSKQHRSNDRFIISFCNKSSRSRKRKGPISSIEDRHADYIEEAALDRSNASTSGILENNEAILDNGNKDSLGQSSNFPHITAEKYAFRSAVLSSLVVAWSPILKYSGTCFSILSVGVKSGS